jgi:DNA-3-methyladenine glycosylase
VAKLSRDFYTRPDVVRISRELIGKHLFTRMNGRLTGGIIVETEAYAGPIDRASHAYNGRRTKRNEPMYATGGTTYVYLCYGIHHLFNIATNEVEIPHAVLVRAIEPTHGIDTMLRRRKLKQLAPRLTAGPGALAQALAINTRHTGLDLLGNRIWIEERLAAPPRRRVEASPRVGIGYAGTDRDNPWRFRVRNCTWTSPAK